MPESIWNNEAIFLFVCLVLFLLSILLVCILITVACWGLELNAVLPKFHCESVSRWIAELLQVISCRIFPHMFTANNSDQVKNRMQIHLTMCSHLHLHRLSCMKTWYQLHMVKLSNVGVLLHLDVASKFSLTLITGYFETWAWAQKRSVLLSPYTKGHSSFIGEK